jgi:hypothetical protein
MPDVIRHPEKIALVGFRPTNDVGWLRPKDGKKAFWTFCESIRLAPMASSVKL